MGNNGAGGLLTNLPFASCHCTLRVAPNSSLWFTPSSLAYPRDRHLTTILGRWRFVIRLATCEPTRTRTTKRVDLAETRSSAELSSQPCLSARLKTRRYRDEEFDSRELEVGWGSPDLRRSWGISRSVRLPTGTVLLIPVARPPRCRPPTVHLKGCQSANLQRCQRRQRRKGPSGHLPPTDTAEGHWLCVAWGLVR